MCRLLGFRFAPRIRDLKEKRLYVLPGMTVPPELATLAAGAINLRVISDHWFELLHLALSIKTGTVTASVILRKLAAYPRQNGLALALRELGKLERTFFTLQCCRTSSCVVAATSASTAGNSAALAAMAATAVPAPAVTSEP
jgi:TnpA family transposase